MYTQDDYNYDNDDEDDRYGYVQQVTQNEIDYKKAIKSQELSGKPKFNQQKSSKQKQNPQKSKFQFSDMENDYEQNYQQQYFEYNQKMSYQQQNILNQNEESSQIVEQPQLQQFYQQQLYQYQQLNPQEQIQQLDQQITIENTNQYKEGFLNQIYDDQFQQKYRENYQNSINNSAQDQSYQQLSRQKSNKKSQIQQSAKSSGMKTQDFLCEEDEEDSSQFNNNNNNCSTLSVKQQYLQNQCQNINQEDYGIDEKEEYKEMSNQSSQNKQVENHIEQNINSNQNNSSHYIKNDNIQSQMNLVQNNSIVKQNQNLKQLSQSEQTLSQNFGSKIGKQILLPTKKGITKNKKRKTPNYITNSQQNSNLQSQENFANNNRNILKNINGGYQNSQSNIIGQKINISQQNNNISTDNYNNNIKNSSNNNLDNKNNNIQQLSQIQINSSNSGKKYRDQKGQSQFITQNFQFQPNLNSIKEENESDITYSQQISQQDNYQYTTFNHKIEDIEDQSNFQQQFSLMSLLNLKSNNQYSFEGQVLSKKTKPRTSLLIIIKQVLKNPGYQTPDFIQNYQQSLDNYQNLLQKYEEIQKEEQILIKQENQKQKKEKLEQQLVNFNCSEEQQQYFSKLKKHYQEEKQIFQEKFQENQTIYALLTQNSMKSVQTNKTYIFNFDQITYFSEINNNQKQQQLVAYISSFNQNH
ncbi:hypothetical protein PPERSA_03267 [Pseudocohnilembus persalinus]|uniref:Uncharacterized protein n=1 Tax=Pseudocohnilembus persalinus TaxID=266149 RepID=A0A0V0QZF1_PSEPJ|nr:hypothetical protein PPERSA_03267 [Pseudocohnilembus persalinus]|eukprot:KRX07434.1 hypothetical protein PPERSA_03267 [Pseudocohnilembus persalinus]